VVCTIKYRNKRPNRGVYSINCKPSQVYLGVELIKVMAIMAVETAS